LKHGAWLGGNSSWVARCSAVIRLPPVATYDLRGFLGFGSIAPWLAPTAREPAPAGDPRQRGVRHQEKKKPILTLGSSVRAPSSVDARKRLPVLLVPVAKRR
jgi:hypothetical protein